MLAWTRGQTVSADGGGPLRMNGGRRERRHPPPPARSHRVASCPHALAIESAISRDSPPPATRVSKQLPRPPANTRATPELPMKVGGQVHWRIAIADSFPSGFLTLTSAA